MNHDQRILEIQGEMNKLGKSSKTREEWKSYFRLRGYEVDEFDLGYALSAIKMGPGSLLAKRMPLLVFLILVAVFSMALWWGFVGDGSYKGLKPGIIYFFVFFAAVIIFYSVLLSRQFKKYYWQVIRYDLEVKAEDSPSALLKLWKGSGAEFLGRPDATIENVFRLTHADHDTYFGNYAYRGEDGRWEYFFIAQKAKKVSPHARCVKPMYDYSVLRPKIKLEGVDLNTQYNVYAKGSAEARCVFIPLVVSTLLDSKSCRAIRSFEVAEDWVILVFEDVVRGGIRLMGPMIHFGDYQKVKRNLLAHLDLATSINNMLSREVVDNGVQRSKTKLV